MRANNLSISIPYKGCNKDCSYCVSKMTGYIKTDKKLFLNNLDKVYALANRTNISSVSITGKGEPLLNLSIVKKIATELDDFPLELQTNGLELLKNTELVDILSAYDIDIFAISMDKITDFEKMKPVIDRIHELNKTVRVTMNITDMLPNPNIVNFSDYIAYCKKYNVDQFSLRQITVANNTKESTTHEWIKEHAENAYYEGLVGQFLYQEKYSQFIRSNIYGSKIYDVEGISFTFFDYCIQDNSNSEDIRSLIYMEDGHMYTNWNSLASRIF